MDPIAGVVVLNWNGRDFIRDCLRSVFAQTHGAHRVIVVDNASTDGSADIVKDEFQEAKLVALRRGTHQ